MSPFSSNTPSPARLCAICMIVLSVLIVLSLVITYYDAHTIPTKPRHHKEAFQPDLPDMSEAAIETIFVSLPSYRDTDCTRTLVSLFENADQPNNIFVGLYEQNHPNHSEEQCTLVHNPSLSNREAQIRRVRVTHTDAKGPLWARTHITRLYRGETFMLMIDAHSVFLNHWDTRMKNELHYLRNHYKIANPILSSYPHHSDTLKENDGKPADEKRHLTTQICHVTKADRYPLILGAEEKSSGKYYRTPFIGACFVFTYGEFCTILGNALQSLHLPHIFSGEEILFSAIAYTHGWDVYTPPYINVFHLYEHNKPNWYNDNNVNTESEETDALRASEARLRTLLDSETNDPSCLGSVRTLRQFWEEMGFHRDRIDNQPPPNRTDAETVKDVFPQESKDKWCTHAPSYDYPLLEAFTLVY